jgi:hypothetical protein
MTITNERLAVLNALKPEAVPSAYSGIDGKCCCGCSGTHYHTRTWATTKNDLRQVKRILGIVQAEAAQGNVEDGGNHFASIVGNRVYVVYTEQAEG